MAAELNHLFAMALWTEPASPTAEGEEVLMVTIGAAHTGKTLLKVTTFQVLPNYMRNYWAEEAIFTTEEIVITILECFEMIIKQLPQRRLPRSSAPTNLRFFAPIHCIPFVLLTKAAM